MDLEEGQIYEGSVSLMGEEGPLRNWLVIAPLADTAAARQVYRTAYHQYAQGLLGLRRDAGRRVLGR